MALFLMDSSSEGDRKEDDERARKPWATSDDKGGKMRPSPKRWGSDADCGVRGMDNEIDLHGCVVTEAVDAFVTYYNARVRNGDYNRILVIHGYGSTGEGGKIRTRLRSFLAGHPDELEFEPGENLSGGNLGTTFVFPRKPLPSTIDSLSEGILEFCRSPKTRSKIAGKFRMFGEARIQASLQLLEKQKRLRAFQKGTHKVFQTQESESG